MQYRLQVSPIDVVATSKSYVSNGWVIGGAIAFWEEESDRFKALVIFLAYIR
ncbi:MAG: hypothetical protein F6K25_17805 [Okeania sp. SIO2G4]|nr:hypothetical protein [Okeania sp. SIO2F5]NEP73900.1 hypothetical protein [Okeania sp. SIO2G5]NEP94713.1 hypothetical protein [Okeania sp. SIO2F5]NEQ92438.1 hypothetical protein [Okeania sp. SIO2G4]